MKKMKKMEKKEKKEEEKRERRGRKEEEEDEDETISSLALINSTFTPLLMIIRTEKKKRKMFNRNDWIKYSIDLEEEITRMTK